jgi:hypothetical protein
MTIRSKIETFMLIAAALSVGVATSAEARGLGGSAPRAVAPARVVSLPVHAVAFGRAPVERTGLVSHSATKGAPTLPGCTSQAGCRTVTGGYLNGFRPVGGTGNGQPAGGSGPAAPTQGANRPPFPKPPCAADDCGWRTTGPISAPPSPGFGSGSVQDPGQGGGQTSPTSGSGLGDITDGSGGSVIRCSAEIRCHSTN